MSAEVSARTPSLGAIERAYVSDRVRKGAVTPGAARDKFYRRIASIEREAAAEALEAAARSLPERIGDYGYPAALRERARIIRGEAATE